MHADFQYDGEKTPAVSATHKPLLVVIVIAAAILIVAATIEAFFYFSSQRATTSGSAAAHDSVSALVGARAIGNYAQAVQLYNTIKNDPNATAAEKAEATVDIAGARYYISGDITSRLQDVQDLKIVATDTTVPVDTRATALNTIASAYNDAGKSKAVFDEIYKDVPFSSYLVKNDPNQSARKLYEWSYQLSPNSTAAIQIAKWYSEQYIYTSLTPAEKQQYILSAEDYLKKADSALAIETRSTPSYPGSPRYYANYQYWKALTVTRLAGQGIEPYKSDYRAEFNDFIGYALKSNNTTVRANLFYAQFFYAIELKADNDKPAAEAQANALAGELNALQKPETVSFVRMLDSSAAQPHSWQWRKAEELSQISPSFKAALAKVVVPNAATSTAPSTAPSADSAAQ